ncbi:MAG: DUF4399 domain-containing protein [Ginsengibacter sp.]
MKKILSIPAILFVGLVACNSGTGSESSATDSTSLQTDTSHAAMTTTTVDALPEIPSGAKVSFANLKDGQTVSSPLKVEMTATNISVDSAGTIKPNSGHFHIIIDDGDSIASGIVVPKDSTHLHFGNAQKEATITLSPGKHRLALQFADGINRSYGSKLSEAITVNVKK